jgi:hypothetical protein
LLPFAVGFAASAILIWLLLQFLDFEVVWSARNERHEADEEQELHGRKREQWDQSQHVYSVPAGHVKIPRAKAQRYAHHESHYENDIEDRGDNRDGNQLVR